MSPFHVVLQSTGEWPCSFEQAVAALEKLPRMFIELDGSFVWPSSAAGQAWQLDGCLFDRDGHLQYVELKGTCAREPFASFLDCLQPDRAILRVQIVREATTMSLSDFMLRWLPA